MRVNILGVRQSTSIDDPNRDITNDAIPDDAILSDNDDEREYPNLVKKSMKEDDSKDIEEEDDPPAYESTDTEEVEENRDMGLVDEEEEEEEDRLVVVYNKENPLFAEGSVFPSLLDCKNALSTFAIKREFDYPVEKSDSKRPRASCAYKRCKWRIHGSYMRNITIFQV